MKILLFGNIGSGKTTLAKRINEMLFFELTAIDNFRRIYGNGTLTGEKLARKCFFESITEGDNQLIECTGVGQVGESLFEVIYKMSEPVIVLTLLVPQYTCKQRLNKRIWDIPFPHPVEEVSDFIDRVEYLIQDGVIDRLWKERQNTLQLCRENNNEHDLEQIISELTRLIKLGIESPEAFAAISETSIDQMLHKEVQHYYSHAYASYQMSVIEKNPLFVEDRAMISNFIKKTEISGSLADIGAGNCQWFHLLENKVELYYALEINQSALNQVPKSRKLVPIQQNIFDPEFDFMRNTGGLVETVLLSFFLSHFSDQAIAQLFQQFLGVPKVLIIDSFWSEGHRKKYLNKELRNIRRKTAPNFSINLPKRFFEQDELQRLAKLSGYQLIRFEMGNYWFICQLERKATF